MDYVEGVEKALGCEAAFIDFGHFGVVEFAEIGNAAYLYPKSVFQSIVSRATMASGVVWLKEMDATIQSPSPGPTGTGRIIHAGDWQNRYTPWVRQLIGIKGSF